MSGPSVSSRGADPHKIVGPTPIDSVSPAQKAPGSTDPSIRNEPRRAVALSYDPNNADAPVVTAVGQGAVAEEIIRRAREAGVPVTEDPRLAGVLSQIDVGQVIPPELYVVVAEVLAYVYRLEERVARRRG
jgi:flagellar biosynthesis protein